MSGRGKRRAAAPAAAPRAQRHRAAAGALAEDALDPIAAGEAINQQLADRAYWAQYSTELLAHWEIDHQEGNVPEDRIGDREFILDQLVSNRRQRIAVGKELSELRSVWTRLTKPPRTSTPPGMFREQERSAPAPSPAPMLAAPSSHRTCLTCARPAPLTPGPWLCFCGLRGDLGIEAPANVFLNAQMQARSAPAAPSASPASSGQSQSAASSSAGAAVPVLGRLDKHFALLSKNLPAQTVFTGPMAGAPLPVVEALQESRKAYLATATRHPSEALISIIREGKLNAPSFAVPKGLTMTGDEEETQGIELGDGGSVIARSKGVVPPALRSSDDLSMAIMSTIIPALIDRPRAIMQWCVLGRTALRISEKHGWSAAASYVQQVLNERLPQGLPLADISVECLLAVQHEAPRAAAAAGGGAAPQRAEPRNNTCHDWNKGACTRGATCRWPHECPRIARGCPKDGHRGMDCPLQPAAGAHATTRSGGPHSSAGSRRSGKGGSRPGASDSSTVASAVKEA